jgi:hypothetical protein
VEAFLPACSSFGQHKSASETRRFTLFAKPIGGRWTRACCSEERQGPSRAWRPSCQWRGSRARFPARDGIFGASFVVGSRARAPPCIRPCHSPRLRRCRPAGTWVAGNMLGEIARVIASNCTPGKGRKSGPRRKPSCLMSSGYQPTLWKGAILRAPLI